MSIAIRTLSSKDAEMLARTIVTGVVSNGCVQRYDLRWRSDALRAWEVSQRWLGKKPEVQIRIDELNLAVVYVEPLDGSHPIVRAISTHPTYTHELSLYEHKKLKEKMKELRLRDRIIQMGDERAFSLRTEYYATLGHADDPTAYRRLVGLRDQLAALRTEDQNTRGSSVVSAEANAVVPKAPDKPAPSPKRRTRKRTSSPTPESANAPIANQDPAPITAQSQNAEADSEYSFTPTLPHFHIKRTPL